MPLTDLILILWPIFFVAATQQDPHLKPRDFKKSAEWVAERARGAAESASIPRQVKGATTFEGVRPTVNFPEQAAEPPYWESRLSYRDSAPNLVSYIQS